MNKIISISTKDYTPLSYQGEYYHKKYDLIKSFLSEKFGNDFSKILAQPLIEGRNIEWEQGKRISFKLYGSARFLGLPSLGPLLFVALFAMDLLKCVLFSLERSDLVGGPRGRSPLVLLFN